LAVEAGHTDQDHADVVAVEEVAELFQSVGLSRSASSTTLLVLGEWGGIVAGQRHFAGVGHVGEGSKGVV